MTRSLRGIGGRQGLPPGTLAGVEGEEAVPTRIDLICWGREDYRISESVEAQDLGRLACEWPVRWIRVRGLGDLGEVARIGEAFGIDPLQLEDAVNSHDRPKAEEADGRVFVSAGAILPDPGGGTATVHMHIGFMMHEDTVISFEQGDTPQFEAVIERMKRPGSRLRRLGVDYLLYALLDAVIDGYFVTLEHFADSIERLEEDVVAGDGEDLLQRIHSLRNEMLGFRRTVWPLRELVGNLVRTGTGAFSDEVGPYLRDLYDHAIQVIETAETLREMLAGMLDTYLSSVNNRMSQVMKVLTVIATVFMPLTFIAGIYGMNFEHMPELQKPWAYPLVLALMLCLGTGMLAFFKRKGWL